MRVVVGSMRGVEAASHEEVNRRSKMDRNGWLA